MTRSRLRQRFAHPLEPLDLNAPGPDANRAEGGDYLAQLLGEQDLLRACVIVEEATNLLWILISFDSFDLLYAGRALSADEAADVFITTAERSLCR